MHFRKLQYKKTAGEGGDTPSPVVIGLKEYRPRDSKHRDERLKFLNNAKKNYNGREMIINAFKDKIFSLYLKKKKILKMKMVSIIEDEDGLELIQKHFRYQNLKTMLKELNKSKNTERNKIQVNLIKK